MMKKTTNKKNQLLQKNPTKKQATPKSAVKKKTPVQKKSTPKKKPTYNSEQIFNMTEQAAYFAALNEQFKKDPCEYWNTAQEEIRNLL